MLTVVVEVIEDVYKTSAQVRHQSEIHTRVDSTEVDDRVDAAPEE